MKEQLENLNVCNYFLAQTKTLIEIVRINMFKNKPIL